MKERLKVYSCLEGFEKMLLFRGRISLLNSIATMIANFLNMNQNKDDAN